MLPRRIGAYSAAWLDQLCASGEVVWVGAGALGRRSGKVALYFRDDAAVLGPPPGRPRASSSTSPPTPRSAPGSRRAPASSPTCSSTSPGIPSEELQEALWDLVWAGEVTNDAFAPLRSPRAATTGFGQQARAERARRRRFGARRGGCPAADPGPLEPHRPAVRRGRAATRPAAAARRPSCCSSATASSRASTCSRRGSPAGSPRSTTRSRRLETIGVCQRGYFVEGLGGAQFALPGAAERLRAQRDDDAAPPVVLAATDPAQPYGAALKWPKRESRSPARQAGAHVVLAGAEPVLYVERGGKGLQILVEPRTTSG